jgi:hypothetical protein
MIHGGNMSDALWGIFLGVFITIVTLGAISDLSQNSPQNIIKSAINDCEKSLPRDQHCTIIAVPISKD